MFEQVIKNKIFFAKNIVFRFNYLKEIVRCFFYQRCFERSLGNLNKRACLFFNFKKKRNLFQPEKYVNLIFSDKGYYFWLSIVIL